MSVRIYSMTGMPSFTTISPVIRWLSFVCQICAKFCRLQVCSSPPCRGVLYHSCDCLCMSSALLLYAVFDHTLCVLLRPYLNNICFEPTNNLHSFSKLLLTSSSIILFLAPLYIQLSPSLIPHLFFAHINPSWPSPNPSPTSNPIRIVLAAVLTGN